MTGAVICHSKQKKIFSASFEITLIRMYHIKPTEKLNNNNCCNIYGMVILYLTE